MRVRLDFEKNGAPRDFLSVLDVDYLTYPPSDERLFGSLNMRLCGLLTWQAGAELSYYLCSVATVKVTGLLGIQP